MKTIIEFEDKISAIRALKADTMYGYLWELREELRLLARGKKEVANPIDYIYQMILDMNIDFDEEYP